MKNNLRCPEKWNVKNKNYTFLNALFGLKKIVNKHTSKQHLKKSSKTFNSSRKFLLHAQT